MSPNHWRPASQQDKDDFADRQREDETAAQHKEPNFIPASNQLQMFTQHQSDSKNGSPDADPKHLPAGHGTRGLQLAFLKIMTSNTNPSWRASGRDPQHRRSEKLIEKTISVLYQNIQRENVKSSEWLDEIIAALDLGDEMIWDTLLHRIEETASRYRWHVFYERLLENKKPFTVAGLEGKVQHWSPENADTSIIQVPNVRYRFVTNGLDDRQLNTAENPLTDAVAAQMQAIASDPSSSDVFELNNLGDPVEAHMSPLSRNHIIDVAQFLTQVFVGLLPIKMQEAACEILEIDDTEVALLFQIGKKYHEKLEKLLNSTPATATASTATSSGAAAPNPALVAHAQNQANVAQAQMQAQRLAAQQKANTAAQAHGVLKHHQVKDMLLLPDEWRVALPHSHVPEQLSYEYKNLGYMCAKINGLFSPKQAIGKILGNAGSDVFTDATGKRAQRAITTFVDSMKYAPEDPIIFPPEELPLLVSNIKNAVGNQFVATQRTMMGWDTTGDMQVKFLDQHTQKTSLAEFLGAAITGMGIQCAHRDSVIYGAQSYVNKQKLAQAYNAHCTKRGKQKEAGQKSDQDKLVNVTICSFLNDAATGIYRAAEHKAKNAMAAFLLVTGVVVPPRRSSFPGTDPDTNLLLSRCARMELRAATYTHVDFEHVCQKVEEIMDKIGLGEMITGRINSNAEEDAKIRQIPLLALERNSNRFRLFSQCVTALAFEYTELIPSINGEGATHTGQNGTPATIDSVTQLFTKHKDTIERNLQSIRDGKLYREFAGVTDAAIATLDANKNDTCLVAKGDYGSDGFLVLNKGSHKLEAPISNKDYQDMNNNLRAGRLRATIAARIGLNIAGTAAALGGHTLDALMTDPKMKGSKFDRMLDDHIKTKVKNSVHNINKGAGKGDGKGDAHHADRQEGKQIVNGEQVDRQAAKIVAGPGHICRHQKFYCMRDNGGNLIDPIEGLKIRGICALGFCGCCFRARPNAMETDPTRYPHTYEGRIDWHNTMSQTHPCPFYTCQFPDTTKIDANRENANGWGVSRAVLEKAHPFLLTLPRKGGSSYTQLRYLSYCYMKTAMHRYTNDFSFPLEDGTQMRVQGIEMQAAPTHPLDYPPGTKPHSNGQTRQENSPFKGKGGDKNNNSNYGKGGKGKSPPAGPASPPPLASATPPAASSWGSRSGHDGKRKRNERSGGWGNSGSWGKRRW